MECLGEHLASDQVFSKLAPADRAELVRQAQHLRYGRGAFICQQGEVWANAVYIVSGHAEWAILSPTGKRQVVFELSADELLWGHSPYDDEPVLAARASSLQGLQTDMMFGLLATLVVALAGRGQRLARIHGSR